MIFLIRLFLSGKKDKLFSKQLKAGLINVMMGVSFLLSDMCRHQYTPIPEVRLTGFPVIFILATDTLVCFFFKEILQTSSAYF